MTCVGMGQVCVGSHELKHSSERPLGVAKELTICEPLFVPGEQESFQRIDGGAWKNHVCMVCAFLFPFVPLLYLVKLVLQAA